MEQVQQCTASIDEIRCQKPAEGSSDLCKTHRKKCQRLYLDYKNICSKVPDFNYCNIDISQISIDDLSVVAEDLKKQYILFQKCIQARDRHNSVCYVLECRDQNHADFVQKVINAMNQCDTTLTSIYDRINKERIRIAEEQSKLNKVEETTQEVEQMQNVVEKTVSPKKMPEVNKELEEELAFIEAQNYAKTQREIQSQQEDKIFYGKIMDLLSLRGILSDQVIYFYTGSLLRAILLFGSKFPNLREQTLKLVSYVLDHPEEFDLQEYLKMIPKEFRVFITKSFTILTHKPFT